MRILLLTVAFLPQVGGAEVGVHNLAEGLVEDGHQVLVCAAQAKYGPDHVRHYELYRYAVPRGASRFAVADWWVYRALLKVAAAWKPDVVHAHFTWPSGYAAIKARERLQVPVVMTPRGGDLQVREEIAYGYRLRPALRKKIDTAILRAEGLVALSPNLRMEMIRIGAAAERIIEAPNGINLPLFSTPQPEARAQLGFSEDRFIMLSVGRNHPVKGFADLIHAVALLVKKNPEALCVIVGPDVPQLDGLVHECGVTESVRLFDETPPAGVEFKSEKGSRSRSPFPHPSIVPFYHAADLYAMPSKMEGLPVTGIEAMATGLPILATRTPGAEALIQNEINGLLTTIGSPEELAAAARRLIADRDLCKRMGAEGQRLAQVYDRRAIARQHVAFYGKLVES
jgi:glycosyltransferase involved in cell wall biosynthesis